MPKGVGYGKLDKWNMFGHNFIKVMIGKRRK